MSNDPRRFKFGELSDAVHGCAMVVAGQLFAPILAEITWIVNKVVDIMDWICAKLRIR